MKLERKYIALIITLFSVLVLLEYFSPKPVNWNLSYSKKDKIPYGSFIAFNSLPDLFPGRKIETGQMPVYNMFRNRVKDTSNYIIVNDNFSPDKLDTKELLSYVERGNRAFIAAEEFKGMLADTFKLKTTVDPVLNFQSEDSISLSFTDTELVSKNSYRYKKGTVDFYFQSYDTAHTSVLGINSLKQVNFIAVKHGLGTFYLSTVPLAFTNYNILSGNNAEYFSHALSYLPVADTWWDEYYKAGKQEVSTPLRFILNTEALRWAYFILLLGLIIYIVFEGKRKQRIIPVLKPLNNTSLEFVETVGRLYFQKGLNSEIAKKKIKFLMNYIQSELNIRTGKFDDAFYQSLSQKTQINSMELEKLFTFIEEVQAKRDINATALLTLNNLIEDFYKKNK